MKKIVSIIGGIVMGVSLSSCSDFLSQYPKDQTHVNSTDDMNELLVGEGYMPASTGTDINYWLHVMDDDIAFYTSNSTSRPSGINFFWWEPYLDTENSWVSLYRRINILNAILGDIEEFKDEPGDGYRKVKGESLFLRASYYYFLVNLYAQPYRATTAATDPGVPLKLSNVIEDKRYARNTVQQCYDQILSDLRTSVACLKGLPKGLSYRASEMAARHLLSRVCLYIADQQHWEEAVLQCDTIIHSGLYRLLDFNTLANTASAVSPLLPETIFTNGAMTTAITEFGPLGNPRFHHSEELTALYDPNDRRVALYYRGFGTQLVPQKYANFNDGRFSNFFIFRLPGTYLNRAEALVMLGRDGEAIQSLQTLRTNRLPEPLDAITLSGQELINFVRDERRRELSFEGQRWFDLRRYAVSPKWPYQKSIRHPYYEYMTISGYMVLHPYDQEPEYYVLPLPESEINLNGGVLKQNPERVRKTPEDI